MENQILLFLNDIGTTELLLIAAVAVFLFGGKKIPEVMRGLGRGVKEFKDAMNKDYLGEKQEEKPTAEKKEENKIKEEI